MLKISLSLSVVFVLFVTHAHALDENAPRWNPMWEVAWLPMAIRVSELGEDEEKYGLTDAQRYKYPVRLPSVLRLSDAA